MTVRDLQEELSKFPEDTPVVFKTLRSDIDPASGGEAQELIVDDIGASYFEFRGKKITTLEILVN